MVREKIINLPKICDRRGNLTFIEGKKHIPFEIKRVYWIYDVPGGEDRGGHAFREQCEFIVAMSGSFDVAIDNGGTIETYRMNRSYLYKSVQYNCRSSLAFQNDKAYYLSHKSFHQLQKLQSFYHPELA